MAWLSDATGSPSTRFVQSTGPYRLVNGTTIAANWDDLTTQKPDGTYLAAPINFTETEVGTGNSPVIVWTHTLPDGTAGGTFPDWHCENWSYGAPSGHDGPFGGVGISRATDTVWTDLSNIHGQCNIAANLYCFQQS